MKSLKGFAFVIVIFVSLSAFSSIEVVTLNCGAPKTNDNRMIVGVGYDVQIKTGYDAHVINKDGTYGAPIVPSFRLVSKVVSPTAQPRYEDLNLVSRDANGNYNLTGLNEVVIVNKNFNQAFVNFNDSATASCD
jgi:hypothetical protein